MVFAPCVHVIEQLELFFCQLDLRGEKAGCGDDLLKLDGLAIDDAGANSRRQRFEDLLVLRSAIQAHGD